EIPLRAYRQVVQVDLARIRQDIEKAAADLRETPSSNPAKQLISDGLSNWSAYSKPLELLDAHKGRDVQEARGVFELVRSLCIDLANNLKRFDLALAICSDCASAFKDLPRASAQLAEDIRHLEREGAAAKVLQDLEGKRYGDAISGIDTILKGELSDEERRTFQKLREVARAKRRGMYTRW